MGQCSFFIFVLVMFLSVGTPRFLRAQESRVPPEPEVDQESLHGAPFPIGPILMTALQKDITWRPDWAISIPPDAFALTSGQPVSITLVLEEAEYRVCWKNGSLTEFPVLVQGSLAQVRINRIAAKKIERLTITTDRSWEFAIIRQDNPYRSLGRLTEGEGGEVYFIALESNHTGISETWYDPAGNALEFFTSRSRYAGEDLCIGSLVSYAEGNTSTEWYEYDSFGNVSAIAAAQGRFSALYYQKGYQASYPRYWERQVLEAATGEDPALTGQVQHYTLQWDEQGFLVRMQGFLVRMIEGSDPGPEMSADIRYEYTLDKRGNWTERREIRMIRRLGVLVPSPGLTIKRHITYAVGG
ncbi:MAG: hypothetical protein LBQ30_02480 [Treponema sp.]|nr:hypothetical protein [Treponema sp.]